MPKAVFDGSYKGQAKLAGRKDGERRSPKVRGQD
jgi:hypothetical protein